MFYRANADSPTILLSGIIENAVNPFTGNPVKSKLKEDGALVTISNLYMPHHFSSKNIFTVKPDDWYRVSDNIFESKNWKQETMEESKK